MSGDLNAILGVIASIPCAAVLRGSVPVSLTLRRAHVRIKSVYIAEIPAIRITGSPRNFASRVPRRVFGVSCLVAINFRVCTLRRLDCTHAAAAVCVCVGAAARYTKTPRESGATQIFPVVAATRTYLRCPPRASS